MFGGVRCLRVGASSCASRLSATRCVTALTVSDRPPRDPTVPRKPKHKPNSVFSSSDWTCSSCGGLNFRFRRACFGCSAARSSSDAVLDIAVSLQTRSGTALGTLGAMVPTSSASLAVRAKSKSPVVLSKHRGKGSAREDDNEERRLNKSGLPLLKDVLLDCEANNDYAVGAQLALYHIGRPQRLRSGMITSIIKLLSRAGQVEKALQVFDGIGVARNMQIRRDAFHYNAILCTLAESDYPNKITLAEKIFSEMRSAQIIPNKHIYTTLISVFMKERAYGRVVELYEAMDEEGVTPDVPLYNSVIAACNKRGMTGKAEQLFELMRGSRKLRLQEQSYGAAIMTAARNCDSSLAVERLERAKTAPNVAVNQIMFTAAMTACLAEGKWERAMSLFEEMTSSGLQADRGASLTLLKALAMGKQSRAAHALYSQMSAKYTNNTASLYCYTLDAMDEWSTLSDDLKKVHLKSMLGVYKDGVSKGVLTPIASNPRRIVVREYQYFGSVFKVAVAQLFRSMASNVFESDIMFIVGTNEANRVNFLFAVQHMVYPLGILKTQVIEGGKVIVVTRSSLIQWATARKAHAKQATDSVDIERSSQSAVGTEKAC